MSDFDDIFNAVTQEASEAALFKWTLRLMTKWKTTGINELEGEWLMRLLGGKEKVWTAVGRQRQRELRFEKNGKLDGLQYAAIVFEKDVRTIRRWCKKNYFPGATRTKGCHWRIPHRVVEEVRRLHPNGFGRGARKLFGTKAWKEFKKDLWNLFGKRVMEASAIEAALQDKSQMEFSTSPVSISSEALDKLKNAVDTGQIGYANLTLLARRLFKEDPNRPINYQLLADALDINHSTLYRRYTKEEVRSAIKGAKNSLRSKAAGRQGKGESKKAAPRELTGAEDNADFFQERFNEIVSDKNTPSPFVLPKGPGVGETDQ